MYETHVGFLHTADLICGILIALAVLASLCILITKNYFQKLFTSCGSQNRGGVYFKVFA